MTYAVKPTRVHTAYYQVPHPTIPGAYETKENVIVDDWGVHDESGVVVVVEKRRQTHWHKESCEVLARALNGTKEESMQYNVIKKTADGRTAIVAGPYDDAEAPYQRKRLAEQHPESEFEVAPIVPDAA